ncbi:MAG: translation elongation factor Ts [Chloroflexota bacterium]|nr:translation elongation factor Ts [Chloroflexota bacterium]MDE3100908.1 translation elongation factor Ts [Chloroflexota bacterium]
MTEKTASVDAREVQRLRTETGAGVMDCKRALEEARGDYEKARDLLKQKGLAAAAKRAGREAREGVVESYIHSGGRIGALVELNSETDFVAATAEFKDLARNIAMQVAAMSPLVVSEEDLTQEARAELLKEHGGDEKKAIEASVLLRQPYIRDNAKTVGDLVTALAQTTGENVRVRRFARFQLGATA